MSVANSPELDPVRDTLARHEWQGALDAARSLTFDDPATEAERLDLEAEAAWWLGQLEGCIAAREEAYRLYEEVGDHRQAGQCAVWLWEHHAIYARPAIASAWLRRARRALEDDTECVEHGNLLLREAEMTHGAGELDEAAGIATRALELGRRLRSTDLEAEALQTKGRILIDQGLLLDGMGHLDEAMLFAVEGRLRPFSTGKVYCSLIAACEEVGDFDRAAEWTEATLRWAEANHPFAIWPGICRVHRAVVLKRRGALAEAEVEAARACEELGQSHRANSAAAYAEVGDIRRRLGDLDEAEQAFARSQEISGGPCGGLALLRLAQGRVDAAMSIITGCVDRASSRLARAGLLPMLVHVAIAADQIDVAGDAQARLAEIVEAFDTPTLRATEQASLGRLQLALHEPAATETLRAAAESWKELDVPYEEATARTLLGQALREGGDTAGAKDSFAAAAALFEQIGARLDARLVYGNTKTALPAGLTEREVEVLRLIAAGLTNNEIASELYLSTKTVSRHLSNIFTKIGVSSRAGATAFAFEHHVVEAG
ncbi:MAG: response regulator transcription factor [Acidimicrobiales bacterium]